MAEIITIPSPSIFLTNSSDPSSANSHDHTHTPAKKSPARRTHQPSQKKDDIKLADANGVTKRKQSKSRNGTSPCLYELYHKTCQVNAVLCILEAMELLLTLCVFWRRLYNL